MVHTLQRVIGFPVVVNHKPDNAFQQTAPFWGNPIEAEPGGHRDMQPLRLTANAKAGFIQMLDRRGLDELTYSRYEPLERLGRLRAHPCDRGSGQPHTE